MADPGLLQNDWSQGMKRDFSRDNLPPGSCWNMVDFVPQDLGAPLRKRGGFTYASPDLSTVNAGASRVEWVREIPFSGGDELLAIDEDGRLYEIASDSSATDIGVTVSPFSRNIVFYRDLLIIPGTAAAPKKYNGSTIANLGGSPPTAFFPTTYKDRLLLGSTSADPERLYFSGAGNPESWDTANGYIDTSDEITALTSIQDAILVFHPGSVERIIGNTPPPGSDMSLQPLWGIGTEEAGSIAHYRDKVIWAGPTGIFWTDGAAVEDLTSRGGIKSYWSSLFVGFDPSAWTIQGGVYRNYYIVTILNASGVLVDTLVCRLNDFSWWRFSNVDARKYGLSAGGSESELYFGMVSLPRVAKVSPMFSPAAANKADADTIVVAPSVETPYFLGQPGFKTWRSVYAGYDLRDAASDNPALTVAHIDSPEETSYTSISPTLGETTAFTRKNLPLRFASHGIALKLSQANASSDTRIYALEADVQARERGRV